MNGVVRIAQTKETAANRISQYKKIEKLGEGTYGVVYKARRLKDGKLVALKRVKLDPNEEGIPATALREVSLLKEVAHPNIIELYDNIYEFERKELYLVFEYMDMDLKMYMDKLDDDLSPAFIRKLCRQLLRAVDCCHAHRFFHRDLKPQNLLINPANGQMKLADFGLGREHGLPVGVLTHEVITLWYRPPEVMLGAKCYGGPVDVWGAGCIFAELTRRQPLFPGECEIDQLFQIFRVLGTPTDAVWPKVETMTHFKAQFPKWTGEGLADKCPKMEPSALDLLSKMLVYSPEDRITATAALKHPYITEEKPAYGKHGPVVRRSADWLTRKSNAFEDKSNSMNVAAPLDFKSQSAGSMDWAPSQIDGKENQLVRNLEPDSSPLIPESSDI